MSLNWDLTNIADSGDMCWIATGDGADRLSAVTEVLIFLSIPIGTPVITPENVGETWERVSMWQSVHGAMVKNPDGSDYLITPEDIKRHVGLKTNVSPLSKTKFNNAVIREMREAARRAMAH